MFKKSLLVALMSLSFSGIVGAELTIKSAEPLEKTIKNADTLNLSEDKRKKIEEITNEYNQQLTQVRPQIKATNKALKTELAKDNLNSSTLENLNKELFFAKEQEQLIRIKYQVALSKVLTAEERKSLNNIGKNTKNANNNSAKIKRTK